MHRHAILAALALQTVAAVAQKPGPRNLLPAPTFTPGEHSWIVAGQQTTAVVDAQLGHSGGHALKVTDAGGQMGQATTPRLPGQPGEAYHAAAWVRLDPELADRGQVDIEFFAGPTFLGAVVLGNVTGTEWQRLENYFPVMEGADSFVLRFMPATSASPAHGAGWIDDVVISRLDPENPALQALTQPVPADDPDGRRGEAPRDLQPTWFAHPPLVDFEDLSGWTCSVFPPATGQFMRSQAMPLAGKHTGRLRFASAEGNGWAVLKPPQPVPIRERFHHIQMWVYGQRRGTGVSPVLVLRDANGKTRRLNLGNVSWPCWSILDLPVAEPLALPAALVAIEVWNLRTPSAEPESVCFDNLACYTQSPAPIKLSLPPTGSPLAVRLPVNEKSIIPTPAPGTKGETKRTGDVWSFTVRSGDDVVEYRYEPRSGTLDDLSVSLNGKTFAPCAGGGVRMLLGGTELTPGAEGLQAKLVGTGGSDAAPEFRFRLSDGKQSAEVAYALRLVDGSLVIDARCDAATGLQAGRPPQETGFAPLLVPYLTYGSGGTPVMAGPNGWLGSWLWDYYRSDASRLSNTDSQYLPLTDGRRNPLRDRLVLTFARQLAPVLPNIPNPAATEAPRALAEVYFATAGPSETSLEALGLWRQLKRYGVDHLIAKQHAGIWSPDSGTGMVPFFQNPHASPAIPGGDAALAEYIRQVKALGYRYALYTDYVLTTPVEAQWSEDVVSRRSDGSWARGWYQAFALTPLESWRRAGRFAPLIARLGNDASYCDQHTSGPAWNRTDYDARKPLAGKFRPVIDAYAAVFAAERRAYRGPVYSEGNDHWMMAGLCDGSYAQFHPPGQPACQTPMLVDFDLLKMHPLEMDLGMGWQAAYGLPGGFDPTGAANDRLLAATIAFGHAGLLYAPWNAPSVRPGPDPLGDTKRIALRTYFMTQQAQQRYLMQPVAKIEYWDEQGPMSAAEAVTSGAIKLSRVHVVYRNELEVWVNGGFESDWTIDPENALVLPPSGYAVFQPGGLNIYSGVMDGQRADSAQSPEYIYADARGHETWLGPLKLSGAAVLKPDGNTLRLIAITLDQTIRLSLKTLRAGPLPECRRLRLEWQDPAGAWHEETRPLGDQGELEFRVPAAT